MRNPNNNIMSNKRPQVSKLLMKYAPIVFGSVGMGLAFAEAFGVIGAEEIIPFLFMASFLAVIQGLHVISINFYD